MGQNEDCSPGGISDSSERLLQSGSGGRSIYKVLVKGEFNTMKHSFYKRLCVSYEDLMSQTRLHFPFSLSCIGEGNGTPLQCSCLENPRDGGAWWAAVYGVAQSRPGLTRLSSSSSSGNVTMKGFSASLGMRRCKA